ncbi:MAG: hypothetical protein AB1861_20335 [Cyanobacteriota bacterium]
MRLYASRAFAFFDQIHGSEQTSPQPLKSYMTLDVFPERSLFLSPPPSLEATQPDS